MDDLWKIRVVQLYTTETRIILERRPITGLLLFKWSSFWLRRTHPAWCWFQLALLWCTCPKIHQNKTQTSLERASKNPNSVEWESWIFKRIGFIIEGDGGGERQRRWCKHGGISTVGAVHPKYLLFSIIYIYIYTVWFLYIRISPLSFHLVVQFNSPKFHHQWFILFIFFIHHERLWNNAVVWSVG